MTSVDRIRGLSGSLAVKAPVAAATTANIALSGAQTIDGVAVVAGNRVLVKDQTDSTENGIYDVDSGSWSRSLDFDGNGDFVEGTLVPVNAGTTNSGIWRLDTVSPAIGDALLFEYAQMDEGSTQTLQNKSIALGDNTVTGTKAQFNTACTDGDFVFASDQQAQAYVAFTTGGTSTAYTLTPTPAIAALVASQRFHVNFHAAAGATPTLAVSGLTAKNLKYRDTAGAKQAITSTQVPSGWVADVEYDGTDWVVLDVAATPVGASSLSASALCAGDIINGRLDYSLSGNALTVRLKTTAGADPGTTDPVLVAFRSATLTDGGNVVRSVTSALSLTISSGSTLGTTSAQFSSVAVRLIDNAGTVEMAADNLAGGNNLDESTLITTTAEGGAGAADSATAIYSTTARTNVAWRLLGLIESTQTTAGTWAQTPSAVKTVGAAGLQSIGYGQTWQNVSGSRTAGVTYYNTTGKPITLALQFTLQATPSSVTINGNTLAQFNISSGAANVGVTYVVPPGGSYSVGFGWTAFFELR